MVLVNSRAPRLIQFRYTVEPRHNNPRYNDIHFGSPFVVVHGLGVSEMYQPFLISL